jgi:hypothetical protein|nr:MAG TPA: DNA primase [Crassvirales sp.]
MQLELRPVPEKLSQEVLLKYNSEETYMEHYLGIPVKKGLFKSPLRRDNTPTCSFYRDSCGRLIFKDFRGDFYGNFIEVVKYKYGVSYPKALAIIANDFGIKQNPELKVNKSCIKEYSNNKLEKSEESIIKVKIKDFTEEELDWWRSYGITLNTLKKFFVFSCEIVFLNDQIYSYSSSTSFNFGYFYPSKDNNKQYWRIYYPQNRKYRFISNWNKTMIQGIHMMPKSGEFLVITKSMKDVMLCYELGIPAIAPNSENLFITDSQWDNIVIKFKHIFLLYDTDLAGVANSKRIKKKFPKIQVLLIPRKYKAKDITDLYKKLGTEKMLNLVEEAKKYYLQ